MEGMGTNDRTMMVTPSMILRLGEGIATPSTESDKTMMLTPDQIVGDQSMVMGGDRRDQVVKVVGRWHLAINTGDAPGLTAVCHPKLVVGSSQGITVLRHWLTHTSFRAKPIRWFCGGDGTAVVEQQARWRYREGELSGVVASAFVVRAGLIQKFDHFDELATALTMYGLRDVHEVKP
jgi:hypothetical protein